MTIVAYTYRAETLCPGCIIAQLIGRGEASPAARDMRVEEVLDQIAGANGIDRDDEHSFDSDDFPKVVLGVSLEEHERCDGCDGEL